jgi:hypothetical protein
VAVIATMPIVGAMRPHAAVVAGRIAVGITRACADVTAARSKVSVAAGVSGRSMCSAAGMTAGGVTAAAAEVTAATAGVPTSTATAIMLSQRGRRAYQDRSQYAGRQKKALSPSTHDCHLLEPLYIRPTLYNAVQAVWCT